MKVEDGLMLAMNHMRDTLTPLDFLWLRPGWQNIFQSSVHMRWEFPTGGTVVVTFSFDIVLSGKGPKLTPISQLTASIGSHLEEGSIFVEVLGRVTAAARRALLLMRAQTYSV